MATPIVSALIGRCQVCGTDGSIARMNSVWRDRREIRYHTVCGVCSHLFVRASLKPHPFRLVHMSALGTDGWYLNRTQWSPVGGADGRGRFLLFTWEAESLVRQLRSSVYLAPNVTEEQLAPSRALLRGDGPASDVFTAEMFALGARQYELGVERERDDERRRRRLVRDRRQRRREADEVGEEPQPEPPAVEVVEVVPVAPETVVAEVIETVADPVRDELLRLVNLDATRRRLTQGQLDEVRMVFDRGEFARSVKMLRQMLAASVSVARPKFPTATYTCKRCEKTIEGADAFKIVWQWRKDGEDLVPDALADIDIFEKYVKDGPQPLCGSCGREARELVLKLRNRHGWKSNPYWTHRFLDQPSQPPTPPLERPPEPLTAKAEERVVQTAAATATA